MDKHYRTLSSVMLLLLREVEGNRQILLQKRQNTGFADGKMCIRDSTICPRLTSCGSGPCPAIRRISST